MLIWLVRPTLKALREAEPTIGITDIEPVQEFSVFTPRPYPTRSLRVLKQYLDIKGALNLQVMEFGSTGNNTGICKYRNLPVKRFQEVYSKVYAI